MPDPFAQFRVTPAADPFAQFRVQPATTNRADESRRKVLPPGGPAGPPAPPDNRSWLARGYDALFTAPEFVTRPAAAAAESISTPTMAGVDQAQASEARVAAQARRPWWAAGARGRAPGDILPQSQMRGFAAGSTEGAASLVTPGDVVLTATGLRGVKTAAQGVRGASRTINALQTAGNVATVARGAERVVTADTTGERLAGVAQVALGTAAQIPAAQQAAARWQQTRRTKQGAQSVQAFTQAVPATKSTRYELEDFHRASPYLDVEHAKAPIQSVERLRDAADDAISAIEDHVRLAIQANPNDLIRTNQLRAVHAAFAGAPRRDALDEGLRAIESLDLDQPMTIVRADEVRQQLNAENKAILKKNHYDVATARAADPAFRAREAAARSLRDGIYQQLEARGSAGVRDLRRDEGSIIKIRDAANNQVFNASKSVAGTAPGGPLGAGVARRLAALGVRSTPGIPAILADPIAGVIAPANRTRDQLVERAFSLRTPAAAPTMPAIPAPPTIRGALAAPAHVTPPPADVSGRVYDQPIPVVHPGGGPAALPPGRGARPEFHLPGEVQPAAVDPSGIRTITVGTGKRARTTAKLPGAPLDYEINPGVNVKPDGFRVKQLASHPDQAAEAVASPSVRAMLQRMKDDFNTIPFQPESLTYVPQHEGRNPFANRPHIPGEAHYTPRVAGTRVGEDIRAISEQGQASNKDIVQAIDDMLAGKKPTDRFHVAALDAAIGYIEKRPGYRGPELPDWAGKSSEDLEDEAFFKMVDEFVEEPIKDPVVVSRGVAKFPNKEAALSLDDDELAAILRDPRESDLARRYAAEALEARGTDAVGLLYRTKFQTGKEPPPLPKGFRPTHRPWPEP